MNPRPCAHPYCPKIVTGGSYCPDHKPIKPVVPSPRGNAQVRGYTKEWRRWAWQYLKDNPSCGVCGKPSEVAGHWEMSGREMLESFGKFLLNPILYRPLCRSCNAKSKAVRGI